MKNIDHIGKDSLETLSRDNLSDSQKGKLKREIISGAIAVVCLLVGLIYSAIYPSNKTVPALLYTIGFLIEGIPVFYSALKGIFSRNFTNAMEMLVAIAIIACYFANELILSVLIPLILNIAHFLEERSIMGGRDIIDGLRNMQQNSAILYEDGVETVVDAKTLKIGQKIIIKPGNGIPIDGTIINGETNIDQKSLTGEPKPVYVKVGDSVYAGTINLDGLIIVEVKKEFVDTSFSHILSFLEKAEKISLPESRLIDKFMRYYIPLILAIAGAVALFTSDVNKAIAVLVVSCPCGQMLVSSAPMIAALSAATKRGILIKSSKFIEELTEVNTVVFDKTGTITQGNLVLTSVVTCENVSESKLLHISAILASASNHPISKAVVAYVGNTQIDPSDYSVKELPGKGLEGIYEDKVIRFGNSDWISSFNIDTSNLLNEVFHGSVSYVTMDNELLGCICFDDTLRNDSQSCIDSLKELGVEKTIMLTGDRKEVAESICNKVGIDEYKAQLLPEDKLNVITDLKNENCVLAIGDGINDALALKEAHVGIAMGVMGSDLAVQSADIALMNENLVNIPFVVVLARKTRNIIYQNIAFSFLVSFVMIILSVFGIVSILAGSLLHNIGAFIVILNSSRILKSDNLQ